MKEFFKLLKYKNKNYGSRGLFLDCRIVKTMKGYSSLLTVIF